jgi:hypothetical protein
MHIRTRLAPEYLGKSGKGLYADVMTEHDEMVGVLLKKLDDLGIADNTIVVYSTDNGAEIMFWPGGTADCERHDPKVVHAAFQIKCYRLQKLALTAAFYALTVLGLFLVSQTTRAATSSHFFSAARFYLLIAFRWFVLNAVMMRLFPFFSRRRTRSDQPSKGPAALQPSHDDNARPMAKFFPRCCYQNRRRRWCCRRPQADFNVKLKC